MRSIVIIAFLFACANTSGLGAELRTLLRNESEAIRILRLLAAEEQRFNKAAVVDQDADGRGEYGLICELTGEVPYRGGEGKRWNPAFIKIPLPTNGSQGQGFASHTGYRFRLFLGVQGSAQGDDRIIGGSRDAPGRTVRDPMTVHAQEMEFNLYAWPESAGATGRFAFHVDSLASAGVLFYSDMKERRYSGGDGPDPFAILRPPASPPHVLRALGRDEKSSDGNIWYPALERVASLRSLLGPEASPGVAAPIEIDFKSQSDGPWTLYQVDDVRLSSEVTAVAVDNKDVWIGIPGGASVFDGASWRSFALERGDGDTVVGGILTAVDGRLWFITRWSAVSYDGKSWRTVEADFPASPILGAVGHKDALWLGFAKHLFLLRDGVWQKFDLRERFFDRDIESLCADSAGNIYIGTYERVLLFDGKTFRTYTCEDGLPAKTYIYGLDMGADGALWAATHSGLFRLDGEKWERVAEGASSDRPKEVKRILCDRHGGVWVFADDRLSRLANGRWRDFDNPLTAAVAPITGMAEAEDGTVYFSGKGGLLRYTGPSTE